MSRSDLGPAWGALALLEGRVRELNARELESPLVGGRSAFVALDWEGHRHLLVPMEGELHPSAAGRGSGIHIATRDLVDGAETRRFLDIACLKPHLNALFDVVAADILASCAESTLKLVPMASRAVLERWRELLDEIAAGRIQGSVLAGAWGELWFVRELLGRGAPWPDLWGGPNGAVQDIRGPNGHFLEVKTTLARGPLLVEIHGIHQLEALPGGRLLLGVLRISHDDEHGESIDDLARTCVAKGASRVDLSALLAALGITNSAKEYGSVRFCVAEMRLYEVDDPFPKVVPSSLATGKLPTVVTSLSYQLDLTGDSPRAMTPVEVQAALDGLAGASG